MYCTSTTSYLAEVINLLEGGATQEYLELSMKSSDGCYTHCIVRITHSRGGKNGARSLSGTCRHTYLVTALATVN